MTMQLDAIQEANLQITLWDDIILPSTGKLLDTLNSRFLK